MGAIEQIGSTGGRIDLKNVLVSLVVAIPPAFGLAFLLSYAADDGYLWLSWVAIVAFTVILYPKAGWRAKVGTGLFYLAVESFLFPLAVLIFSYGVITETSGVLAQLGEGFSALVALSVSWLVSWTVGVVLYLISRRFDSG